MFLITLHACYQPRSSSFSRYRPNIIKLQIIEYFRIFCHSLLSAQNVIHFPTQFSLADILRCVITKSLIVNLFLTLNMYLMFHIKFSGMFMVFLYTRFHMYTCTASVSFYYKISALQIYIQAKKKTNLVTLYTYNQLILQEYTCLY